MATGRGWLHLVEAVFSVAEPETSFDAHGIQEVVGVGSLVWWKMLWCQRATHKLGFPQVGIPSCLTLVVTEVGRCINKDDKHPEGQSCSLPLRSHPRLGSRVCLYK